jgi:phage portal protein BeeE
MRRTAEAKEAIVPELRRESWQMKGKMTVRVFGRGRQIKKAQQQTLASFSAVVNDPR